MRLGAFNGLQLLAMGQVRIPTIVVSGFDDPVLHADARAFGADYTWSNPSRPRPCSRSSIRNWRPATCRLQMLPRRSWTPGASEFARHSVRKSRLSGDRQRRPDDTDVRGIVRRSRIDHTSPQSAQRRYAEAIRKVAAPTRVPAQTGQVARGADARDRSQGACDFTMPSWSVYAIRLARPG